MPDLQSERHSGILFPRKVRTADRRFARPGPGRKLYAKLRPDGRPAGCSGAAGMSTDRVRAGATRTQASPVRPVSRTIRTDPGAAGSALLCCVRIGLADHTV